MDDKKPAPMTDPGLVGKNIYLRLATAEDVANTHHWYLLSDPAMQSSRARPLRTPAEAAEAYKQKELTADEQLFVIMREKDNRPVGIIRYFGWNHLNRSAELGLLMDPDERRKGHGTEAIRLLARWLFRTRDLNKVYAQTSSLNKAAVGMLEKAGFKRDGTLRHHYFYDGELRDGYSYSLLRYEFD
ncbi:MAG: GNAT family protein [Candidatus Zixiibacteriota bacterium]